MFFASLDLSLTDSIITRQYVTQYGYLILSSILRGENRGICSPFAKKKKKKKGMEPKKFTNQSNPVSTAQNSSVHVNDLDISSLPHLDAKMCMDVRWWQRVRIFCTPLLATTDYSGNRNDCTLLFYAFGEKIYT